MAKKPVITAKEAAAMIPNGATIMCGGFLACGQARAIVKELVALGTKDPVSYTHLRAGVLPVPAGRICPGYQPR